MSVEKSNCFLFSGTAMEGKSSLLGIDGLLTRGLWIVLLPCMEFGLAFADVLLLRRRSPPPQESCPCQFLVMASVVKYYS